MSIPKLRKENFKAALAVIKFLEDNPGANRTECQAIIDKHKKCLKNGYFGAYNGKAHYRNYENIWRFLFGWDLITCKYDGRIKRHYITGTCNIPSYEKQSKHIKEILRD